jgi:hypothetical protein
VGIAQLAAEFAGATVELAHQADQAHKPGLGANSGPSAAVATPDRCFDVAQALARTPEPKE